MKFKYYAFNIGTSIPVLIYFNNNILGFSIVSGCTNPAKQQQQRQQQQQQQQQQLQSIWSITDKSIVFANKVKSKSYENIRQNDIIVLIDPIEPNRLILRKVKGIAGDFVWQLVNDGDYTYKQRMHINDNYLWIESLSDRNENNDEIETDSREYQQISSGLVEGIAISIIWPPSRWNIFSNKDVT